MKLSIVIVNYNVKYFLEQALLAVRKAAKGLAVEVFVVDNNSVDDSVQMLREKFPEVKLMANSQNLGFSKANNQAIAQAKGNMCFCSTPIPSSEKIVYRLPWPLWMRILKQAV